jgi:Kinesin motor domain
MSKGKSTSGDRNEGLKILEDARGGVFISGVEETFVKNAAEAVNQHRKGSDRRQIAATKFNDHSSRSHSVFTITVHTKAAVTGGRGLPTDRQVQLSRSCWFREYRAFGCREPSRPGSGKYQPELACSWEGDQCSR